MRLFIFKHYNTSKKSAFCIFLRLFAVCTIQAQEGNGDILSARLNDIRTALDTAIFVNRFQSVETPCVYIDSAKDRYAKPERDIVNSNYRIVLDKNKKWLYSEKSLINYCLNLILQRSSIQFHSSFRE